MISSGCLDFLDEEKINQPPTSVADFVGNGPFEPEEPIIFTGKIVVILKKTHLNIIGILMLMMAMMKALEEIFQIMAKSPIPIFLKELTQ